MAITHTFVSGKADDADATLVRPSNWNADHTIADGSITEAKLSLSDNTTKDVSASQHGLAPKSPNDATKYLDGTGNYSVPTSGSTPGLDYQSIEGCLTTQPWEEVVGGAGIILNEVANGNAIQVFAPGLGPANATLHDDSSFAWVNQGASTVDTSHGGVILTAPGVVGSNVRVRKKTAPATPWRVRALIAPPVRMIDNMGCGLIFRESSSGKLHGFAMESVSGALNVISLKWTNPTTFSATYATAGIANQYNIKGPFWIGIGDDGVNRNCELSCDGVNWFTFHTVTRLDFLTGGADEVGYYAESTQTTQACPVWVVSWMQLAS